MSKSKSTIVEVDVMPLAVWKLSLELSYVSMSILSTLVDEMRS